MSMGPTQSFCIALSPFTFAANKVKCMKKDLLVELGVNNTA
jgi:hypothetical protein